MTARSMSSRSASASDRAAPVVSRSGVPTGPAKVLVSVPNSTAEYTSGRRSGRKGGEQMDKSPEGNLGA